MKMVEWRTQISLSVRGHLRGLLEEIANREKRKLGKVSETILEWGFERLKEAGSTERLLQCRLRLPEAPTLPREARHLQKIKSAIGESKAPFSVSVREAFRTELEKVAGGERKKLSEITELILEWSTKRLDEAGSLSGLLRCGIQPPGIPRQPRGTA
jgi:hypothetical protein